MRKLNLFTYTVFCIILFSNCNLDIEKNINLQKSDYFFSTEQFFQQEASRLSSQRDFTKYVNFNGDEETMTLDTLNFQQEFIPFIKSDINKIIWIDQYTCDTTYSKDQISLINCQAQSPKLKTQNLAVQFLDGKPVNINIECNMQKMLLETMEYLRYERDAYYQVKRIQKLKTGSLDSTLVRVTF
jgi:hypothetical protein